jgi:hypothetical protein
MKTVTLTFSIEIDAKPKTIFEYVSNWEKQSEWILFTKVKLLKGLPNQKDPLLLAITGVGPFKVKDTMVITNWSPYKLIVVEHTGRVVLGKGVFTIEEISEGKSKFIWQEITPIPFGLVGKIGLVLIRPIMNIAFGKSLKKLKNNIEKSTLT